MEQLSVPSIVALFDTNKEQRKSFVSQVVNQMLEGNANPLQLHKQVKAMEEIVKNVLADDSYRNVLLDEASKHGKSFKYLNDDWSIKETGVKYDYSDCNDPWLAELLEEQERLEERIKGRQEFLKTLNSSMTVVIESTGEIITVHPPKKTSTTSVTIKMS